MTNVEKLEEVGKLGSVIGRLGGGEYGNRKNQIEEIGKEINKMTNHELVAKICGWELGDESWWHSLKATFDNLERIDMEEQNG